MKGYLHLFKNVSDCNQENAFIRKSKCIELATDQSLQTKVKAKARVIFKIPYQDVCLFSA